MRIVLKYKKWIVVTLLAGLIFGSLFGFGIQKSFAAGNDRNSSASTTPSGCYLPVCMKWVPAHEDWACYSVASTACSFIPNPAAKAACYAAAYGSCWVPRYCADWERRWYDICPKEVKPNPEPSFSLNP